MDSPLLTKSKRFALDIIKVCNKVKISSKRSLHIDENYKYLYASGNLNHKSSLA